MALHDKTEDVKKFFSTFDKNGDGTISKDELKSIFVGFRDEDIDVMVKAVDKNGDGVVDYKEFANWVLGNGGVTDVMMQMGSPVTSMCASVDAAVKEAFETVDLDKSGAVTLVESLTMAKLVADKFGQPYDESQVKEMFSQGDCNKDGKVTLDEFNAFFKKTMEGVPNDVIFANLKMLSEMFKEAKRVPPCFFTTDFKNMEAPTKNVDGHFDMWIQKHEGKQLVRIHIKPGMDWRVAAAPMLPKLEDGSLQQWCPATHFGYLESGEMNVEFKDGKKVTVKAGEAYLIPPGHLPHGGKDAVMVEFSQDPTYTKVAGETAVAPPPADSTPSEYLCQPCLSGLGGPTKEMGGAKIWLTKGEGRQIMRLKVPKDFNWLESAAPNLPKLADGTCPQWCPATHFGYLESGSMGIIFEDGTEQLIKAGESYHVGPGHRPVMSEDAVMVEFSQDPTWSKVAEGGNKS